jgi:hypothetical protein
MFYAEDYNEFIIYILLLLLDTKKWVKIQRQQASIMRVGCNLSVLFSLCIKWTVGEHVFFFHSVITVTVLKVRLFAY